MHGSMLDWDVILIHARCNIGIITTVTGINYLNHKCQPDKFNLSITLLGFGIFNFIMIIISYLYHKCMKGNVCMYYVYICDYFGIMLVFQFIGLFIFESKSSCSKVHGLYIIAMMTFVYSGLMILYAVYINILDMIKNYRSIESNRLMN